MNNGALEPRESEAAQRAIDALNAEVDQLTLVDTARLQAARRRALDRTPARQGYTLPWQGLAAAVILVAVVIVRLLQSGGNAVPEVTTASSKPAQMDGLFNDLPLLAAGEDVDFYQDLEFLIWLENNNDNAG